MIRIVLAVCIAFLAACSLPTSGEPATSTTTAPLSLECHAHSFLSVGAYTNHWADWSLTVDAAGEAHASIAVVDGPTVATSGPDPALSIRLAGDDASFLIWSANGRGHFVQPYPGLPAGYDVAVDCE